MYIYYPFKELYIKFSMMTKYYIGIWKENTRNNTINNKKICWFCKRKLVYKKHPGLGYLCEMCKVTMGHFQMW